MWAIYDGKTCKGSEGFIYESDVLARSQDPLVGPILFMAIHGFSIPEFSKSKFHVRMWLTKLHRLEEGFKNSEKN